MREHPKLQLYLKKEEYEWLKSIADEKGVSMKEIVLEAIRNVKKFYKEGYDKGFKDGLICEDDVFIDCPSDFLQTCYGEG